MRVWAKALLLGGIVAATQAGPVPAAESAAVPQLAWRACAEAGQAGFQCATARVPLDHAQPDGAKIELAVIRHLAAKPAKRIGALFFNPGGPGGQGTEDLPAWLDLFPQALVDRFDLVSWDPRGIGNSTAIQCFANAEAEARFFAGVPTDAFPVGAAEEEAWIERFGRFAELCRQRNPHLIEHVSTADTARDMDLLRQAVGAPSLTYWGVSYGSLLGAVYANLFPRQVRAMVLDGNVDPIAWTNGGVPVSNSSTSLRMRNDIALNRSFEAFLDRCGRATPAGCAFSAGSPVRTRAKMATLLARLRHAPVTLNGIEVTYALALSAVNAGLFTVEQFGPFRGWERTALVLQTLWEESARPGSSTGAEAAAAVLAAAGAKYTSDWQSSAVQCGESPNARPGEAFRRLAQISQARSGPIGGVVVWADEPCAGWRATAADAYRGPWNRPTAAPILVVGNTFDPSTPYVGSVAMARLLKSARLLTVNGFGHTTLLNPSDCANRHISSYLIAGTLPAAGTACRQNTVPFTGP